MFDIIEILFELTLIKIPFVLISKELRLIPENQNISLLL